MKLLILEKGDWPGQSSWIPPGALYCSSHSCRLGIYTFQVEMYRMVGMQERMIRLCPLPSKS